MVEDRHTTVNPCTICQPLGAVIAFKGIEGAMILLHGSQGCATYMRLYLSRHYKEPIDIGSSALNEKGAIYGGESNLKKGLSNIIEGYRPKIVGVATTCLSETIGDDVKRILKEFREANGGKDVYLVPVSTPSYTGDYIRGFNRGIIAMMEEITIKRGATGRVNIFPGLLSCADIREIKEILEAFRINYIIMPDISDTLDGPLWREFYPIPLGGTRLKDIKVMADSIVSIEFGDNISNIFSPARYLYQRYSVPYQRIPPPIGLINTDRFLSILQEISRYKIPYRYSRERGRLIDAMVDSHKYLYNRQVAIYGDPDMVGGFLQASSEIGLRPVVVATQGSDKELLIERIGDQEEEISLLIDPDFREIEEAIREKRPDIMIGNSHGAYISVREGIPLIRTGFPIYDRMGGQRILHCGYEGAIGMIDRITNRIIEKI